jgi:hypothetical protein
MSRPPKDQPTPGSPQLHIRLTPALHRRLKMIAANNETSVQAVIYHLLHLGLRAAEAVKATNELGTVVLSARLFHGPPSPKE